MTATSVTTLTAEPIRAWLMLTTGAEFSELWQGPFDTADVTRQTSALDALIAATGME
jgi:hypothetical protein